EFWTTYDMDKKNLFAVWAAAYMGTPMFYLNATFDNGESIVSDGSWSIVAKEGLQGGSGGEWAKKVDFDDSAWGTPIELGRWWEFLPTMDILPQTQGIQAKTDFNTAHKSLLARKVFTPTAKGIKHSAERAKPSPPTGPSDLKVDPLWPSRIVVVWKDNDSGGSAFLPEDGFGVERSMNGKSGWQEIGIVGRNVVSAVDPHVVQDKKYFYRVRAFNEVGFSPYSNVGSGIIPSVEDAEANRRRALVDLQIKAVFPRQIDVAKSVKLTAVLSHRFINDAAVEVRVTKLPKGWLIKPGAVRKHTIKANSKRENVEFEITVPKDVQFPYGNYRFGMDVSYEGKVIRSTGVGVGLPVLAKNLARGAKPSTDDAPKQGGREGSLSPGDSALNDGNLGSWSSKAYGREPYFAQLDWKEPKTFNAIAVNGAWGKGPRSFDIIVDGKKIGTREDIKYVGDMYFTRIPETTAKTLRLRIFKCYSGPLIMEIRVFKQP
ncbi:MAG: fibronectin type III domain-containing protein, partial [Planctomycetia bacterium]|nr:fibronectin type III domain-containing protein [Planctomycetia bacterium]